jgi:UDP-2-acetamido-2-deoxy-ribo-hexuluronate aminotransferase
MQFIDLKTQYQRLENAVNQRMQAVLQHGQFIMGPEVQLLEEQLAASGLTCLPMGLS